MHLFLQFDTDHCFHSDIQNDLGALAVYAFIQVDTGDRPLLSQ